MIAATLLGVHWAPWPFAVLAAMAIVGALCLIEERIAVRPVLERAGNAWVITTLAVALILDNAVGKIWGASIPSSWRRRSAWSTRRCRSAGYRCHPINWR